MKSISSAIRGLAIAFCAVVLIAGSFFASAAPASAAEYTVQAGTSKGLGFEPKVVTIKPGDTVTWNIGNLPPHNVVFESADLSALSHKSLEGSGKTFSVTFPADTAPGSYSYFCMPHRGAGMVGKVVVEG